MNRGKEPFKITNTRLFQIVDQLKREGNLPRDFIAIIDNTGAMKVAGRATQDQVENLVYTVQIEEDNFIGV
ncbi:hypothetical protein HNP89_000596 [Methanococcus maripaludis]|uniref:Uncharacterized protein n=1 Tax=Methanococcus maripaludis TaxID=39152 RepID=A0A7J9NY76_METMI|nr:hypothetical protein [Methanococcus maripaludis]MBA2852659.1 hypothetical protein [Methanococcus maripaludis]